MKIELYQRDFSPGNFIEAMEKCDFVPSPGDVIHFANNVRVSVISREFFARKDDLTARLLLQTSEDLQAIQAAQIAAAHDYYKREYGHLPQ
jgi:hypothetical protein